MQAQERLFLTADKKRLVAAGDKRAAFLYAAPGDEIPNSAAEMFGLKDGRLSAPKAAVPPVGDKGKAGKKEGGKAATKEDAGGEDKGRK